MTEPPTPTVRELTMDDVEQVRAFFETMPPQDRTFFYQDVEDPAVIAAWAGSPDRVRRCAVDEEGRLLAIAALQPGRDWTDHVADLVLLVSPRVRRQNVGRTMARVMLLEAVRHDFAKVTVMVAAENRGAVELFSDLGFVGEALLRDQLRDPGDGSLRDAVVLAHHVAETWASMSSAGIDRALG